MDRQRITLTRQHQQYLILLLCWHTNDNIFATLMMTWPKSRQNHECGRRFFLLLACVKAELQCYRNVSVTLIVLARRMRQPKRRRFCVLPNRVLRLCLFFNVWFSDETDRTTFKVWYKIVWYYQHVLLRN